MQEIKFSEDVRPVTDLKMRTSEVIEQVGETRRPVLLTRRGRGVAVLMDLASYEALVERLALLQALDEAAVSARAGDLHPHSEARKILDALIEKHGKST